MENPVEPRWLNSDEREVWLTLVGVMMKLPGALDAQLQRDAGLSHFEYMVLAGLSEAPERTRRMSDLAGFTESGLPRLSQVVGRLEKRGWVSRSTDPSDGRITLATLTDEGLAKIVRIRPGPCGSRPERSCLIPSPRHSPGSWEASASASWAPLTRRTAACGAAARAKVPGMQDHGEDDQRHVDCRKIVRKPPRQIRYP